jgi:WD40 repeat protein
VGSDGSVAIMDVALQTVVAILGGPRTLRGAGHFDPSSQRVVAASWDGAAWLWDARPQHLQWATPEIGEDCGQPDRVDVDHRTLVISCRGHGVQVWDTADRKLVAELSTAQTQSPGARAPADAIVSSGEDRLAVARGRAVVVHELPGGKPIRTIDHASAVNAVAFSPSGHDLLSADADGGLWITRDGADSQLLARLGAASVGAAWLPDGRVVASDTASRLHVYDVRTGASIAELVAPMPYLMFRPSSDGRRLLGFPAGGASSLAVLDMAHDRLIAQLPHEGRLFSARFLDHDRRIVTASSDGSARIWDAETGELQKTYNDRSTFLMDAVVNPAGTMLVTGGGDGKLRFWDLASGRLMWSLQAHRGPVNAIRFDGDDLVTRGFDGDLARWRIPAVPPPPEFVRGIDRVLSCLPVQFDGRSGDLIDQVPRCEFP